MYKNSILANLKVHVATILMIPAFFLFFIIIMSGIEPKKLVHKTFIEYVRELYCKSLSVENKGLHDGW